MQQMGPFGGAASVSGRTARPALPRRLGRLPRRAAGIFLRLSRGGLVALGVALLVAVFVGGALAPRREARPSLVFPSIGVPSALSVTRVREWGRRARWRRGV